MKGACITADSTKYVTKLRRSKVIWKKSNSTGTQPGSEARRNWEGCDGKCIQYKGGGGCCGCVDSYFLGWLDNPVEMTLSTQFLFTLYQQILEKWQVKEKMWTHPSGRSHGPTTNTMWEPHSDCSTTLQRQRVVFTRV